jgi:eukaryotic-like serine/threonine-protein kinase
MIRLFPSLLSTVVVAVVVIIIIMFIFIHKAIAESASDKNLETYENANYGFKIMYPSSWEKLEFSGGIEESGRSIVVRFLSPAEGVSDSFREYLIIEVDKNIQSNKIRLDQYVESHIDSLRRSLQGFNVNELNITSVTHNPEEKVVYSYRDPVIGTAKTMEVWITSPNRLYLISFNADETKYFYYLPLIEKMLSSFKITDQS